MTTELAGARFGFAQQLLFFKIVVSSRSVS
jgi:hypothetical protein